MKISNRDLQIHIHTLGLKKFLEQLEVVFKDCLDDVEDISDQLLADYENASNEIAQIKDLIFPPEDK